MTCEEPKKIPEFPARKPGGVVGTTNGKGDPMYKETFMHLLNRLNIIEFPTAKNADLEDSFVACSLTALLFMKLARFEAEAHHAFHSFIPSTNVTLALASS